MDIIVISIVKIISQLNLDHHGKLGNTGQRNPTIRRNSHPVLSQVFHSSPPSIDPSFQRLK